MVIQPIVNIADICAQRKVDHIVISPGSRNGLLTLAFARHPKIKTFVIPDERSAGYVALGMAQSLDKPVALLCTSGTAAVNYYPAIVEAYYQNTPIIVLTADRPAEWIDKYDGQTIRQNKLYENHILISYQFPHTSTNNSKSSNGEKCVLEAIDVSESYPKGPVHINIPIPEPFYPENNEQIQFTSTINIPNSSEQIQIDQDSEVELALKEISVFKRVMIIPGQDVPHKELRHCLEKISEKLAIPVLADSISNFSNAGLAITYHDTFLKIKNSVPEPDLIITFGRSIISKSLKQFLRSCKEITHWQIIQNNYAADTFGCLQKEIHCEPIQFFSSLLKIELASTQIDFFTKWESANNIGRQIIDENMTGQSFSEMEVVNGVLKSLPENIKLHLANSMIVRWVNMISLNKNLEVYSNRGTSGIDGCTSTALGHSLSSEKINVLLTGDMAFFYDRNAFWHNQIPENLRVIIFNNHGGGIFRLIDGPSQQDELEDFFETNQTLNAENTARDFKLDYYFCSSFDELEECLSEFFQPGKAKILEIETDKYLNQKSFQNLLEKINEQYGS